MSVEVKLHFIVADMIGQGAQSLTVELSHCEGFTVGVMLDALAEHFGDDFIENVYDPREGQLKGPLMITIGPGYWNRRDPDALAVPIPDNIRVRFLPSVIAGG